MIKQIRVKCALMLFWSCILFLTACFQDEFEYTGDYPELFTVAVNSILGATGYSLNSWGGILQPSIHLLEEDDHGRILFSYSEGNLNFATRMIMQRFEGDYVYFYPHYNFILSSIEYNWEFTDEDMAALKEVNNWNQEMSDDSEFVRVRIAHQKEEGSIPRDLLVEAYYKVFPDDNSRLRTTVRNVNSRMIFFRTDDYGRSVYLAVGTIPSGNFAILFQPDHSFDLERGILEITDRYRYQTELRLFMEENDWNINPYLDEN